MTAGAQGLYLMSLYKPLPEACGPMTGVFRAALLRETPEVRTADVARNPNANPNPNRNPSPNPNPIPSPNPSKVRRASAWQ